MSQWTLGAIRGQMQRNKEREDMKNQLHLVINGTLASRIIYLAEALGVSWDQLVFQLLDRALEGHDQTKEEWLENVDSHGLGTGVFLTPDITSKPGAVKKVFVPDITYVECIKRGKAVPAFQWVPHSVSSYEELTGGICSYGPADKD